MRITCQSLTKMFLFAASTAHHSLGKNRAPPMAVYAFIVPSVQKRPLTIHQAKKEKNVFAPTILLPETGFSQRANAVTREPEIQSFWKEYRLYEKLSKAHENNGRFVLHDGPPYANGDLHIGHALNKLLKDFINRHQLLRHAKQVHYVPGWDCHGLPIELKVLQTIKKKKRLGPVELRQKAAQFALDAVAQQSSSFQRYGVYGDFDSPYLTLSPLFEASQIQVFGEMFRQGYIFRGRKPVHWSPSSRTALAEAELEYPEKHISKSIYVKFPITQPSKVLEPYFTSGNDDLGVAIWTTTPWTIPANLAVAINPELDYSVIQHPDAGKLVVATDLVPALQKKWKLAEELEVLLICKGDDLMGTTYRHPLYEDRVSPVLVGGDYITTETGTGLVHTAPGHGQEDYLTGLKNGLNMLSPVDDAGKFTIEAGQDFAGLSVLGDGNQAIIEALNQTGNLLLLENYSHKYPYDWRTKKPTIFRATDQWFASVQGFRDATLEAVDTVHWVPDVGKNRITAFVSGRGDWCISRQRSWGVPIPVFYDKETGNEVLLDDHTLGHIQNIFAEHGSDAWWTMDVVDLLPDVYKDEAEKWVKGTDTMDVWFDSGSSWNGVAKGREELAYPADMYLEGSDQHRGWFQSSLLTSVAVNNRAPYKTVLTHGFVLDEKGFKMSKSLGNVIDPMRVIEGGNNKKLEPPYGVDVLRLWVASVDYSGDVCIGNNILKQTFESYRKLRNTARYLIGNLFDYDPKQHAVPYEELPSLDKHVLGQLSAVLKTVDEAMDDYQFNRATQELLRFCTADLSNFYLDVAKDRLYISAVDDFRRRSCQTVIHQVLEGFTKAVAPILPHMAEDIWQNLPYEKPSQSVFEKSRSRHLSEYPPHGEEKWAFVRKLRDDVNKVLEQARTDKLVGASLDATAYIHTNDDFAKKILSELDGDEGLIHPPQKTNGVDEWRTVLMLSRVHVVDSVKDLGVCAEEHTQIENTLSGCAVGVKKASGQKCGRCWFYGEDFGEGEHTDACQRCNHAITSWEELRGEKFVRATEEKKQPVS